MARRTPEVDRIESGLTNLGPVTMRPMFGGWGVFLDGAMFALVSRERLYLKTDERNRGEFERAGLEPFTFTRKGEEITTSYHRAPEPLEDWGVMEPWLQGAYDAAQRAASRKGSRPRR
ncbi:MAG: TfoX/Sxy family protein [Thermoleophilia bacterium]